MKPLLDIGSQLVAARRAQGVSQRELAEKLGVVQQQVARWEAAQYRTASLERVSAVAGALGLDTGALAQPLLAAEAPATYSATAPASGVTPVRDLGEVVARLREHSDMLRRNGFSRIGVFGSFSTGEQAPESDVDLLVEFSDKPLGFDFIHTILASEEILGRRVDLVEPHLLRERLRKRVLSEVIYVWEA
jgi:hypothetical protein